MPLLRRLRRRARRPGTALLRRGRGWARRRRTVVAMPPRTGRDAAADRSRRRRGPVASAPRRRRLGQKVRRTGAALTRGPRFKLGQRPFQNVLCEGVELGIKGMRAGGKRRLVVPQALAPPGVEVPPGAALVYDVEVKEVLPGYF